MSAMSTPTQSPGWYPAPDGHGQQWWNGASWSDARRNADGSTTLGGLPGYQAAPPPGSAQNIPVPPPRTGLIGSGSGSNAGAPWIVPLVFSIVGFLFFNLFAVIALFIGIAAFRSSTAVGKMLSAVAILISIAAIVSGILSFARGERSIDEIIF
jgi:hypothetical protein